MKRRLAIEAKGFLTDSAVNAYLSKIPGLIEDRICEHPLELGRTTYIMAPIGFLKSFPIVLKVCTIVAQTHGEVEIFPEDKP